MSSSSSESFAASTRRLRCGVIGVTERAEFHAETLAVRAEFELLAVAASHSANSAAAEPTRHQLLNRVLCSREELLRLDLDWVIIASPVEHRVADAIAALHAGHHVVIDVPVSLASEEVEVLAQTARAAQRQCRVWTVPRQEADFVNALQVVQSGMLGRLRTLSFRLRQLAAHLLPDFEGSTRFGDEQQLGVLEVFGWRYLDQLMRLVNEPLARVFGIINHGQLCFDSLSTCGKPAECDTGFLAIIEFQSGVTAQVEIDLASSVTGQGAQWNLQGERGGYAAGKQSILEPDGEVFEVDVQATVTDPYESLRSVNAATDIDSMVAVARLIAAIKRSNETREVVTFGLK